LSRTCSDLSSLCLAPVDLVDKNFAEVASFTMINVL
jgi:hypothetical protein